MGQFAVPGHIRFLKGGGTITYKGTVGKCIWWEVRGVDGGVEGAAYGSLDNIKHVTDADGLATAHYTAPTAALDPDQFDRVYVHEDGIVDESVDLTPSYINLSDWDYKSDGTILDRTNRLLWQFGSGQPEWWATDIDTHALVVGATNAGVTGDVDGAWSAWYYDVAESNGQIYMNDDTTGAGKVRTVSGTDLSLVATSPALPASCTGVWVRGTNVYVQTWSGATRHLTKMPLSLASTTWQTATPNGMGDLSGDLIEDTGGNLWTHEYNGKKLHKFTSAGALTTYDLTGTLPTPGTSQNYITGISYDGNNTLLLHVNSLNGAPGFDHVDYLVAFDMTAHTLGTAYSAVHFNCGGGVHYNGGPRRATPDSVWVRRLDNKHIVEFQISTMTILNDYDFGSQWGLAGGELTDIETCSDGPIWDGATNVLWLFNDYPYDFSTYYGLWRLPLP